MATNYYDHVVITHSHAEAALASRVDAHVTDNVGVVKALIERGGRDDGSITEGKRLGRHSGLLLVRDSSLEEASGCADDGEEKNGKEGTSHGGC